MNPALPNLPKLRNFIAGEFCTAQESDVAILNPSDSSWLAYQAGCSSIELERAVQVAEKCHKSATWSARGEGRAEVLLAIADSLQAHTEELAQIEALNTGVVIKQTRFLMKLLPFIFKAAAEQVLRHPDKQVLAEKGPVELWHKPWGPAVCLAPWNSPAPIGAHKLASALAAGAPVILKPSEFTPFTTQRLFELIASCGLPAGAVQLVHGTSREGAQLVSDSRIKAVSFTGGLQGGKKIAEVCARELKPVQLELGGHNPFVVLPDAPLEDVLDGIMAGLTTLNGQWCRAIGRIFVHESMQQDVLDGFVQRLQQLHVGPALAEYSMMGPLIHRQHKNHLQRAILDYQSQGARVVGGPLADGDEGCYFRPKLITNLDRALDRFEIFGPVATFHTYQRKEDLIPFVNDSLFGLAAYIYGSDHEFMYKMAREFNVGSTKINGVTITSLSPDAPRAAWAWSGVGEEGNFETFRFFQGSRVIGALTA